MARVCFFHERQSFLFQAEFASRDMASTFSLWPFHTMRIWLSRRLKASFRRPAACKVAGLIVLILAMMGSSDMVGISLNKASSHSSISRIFIVRVFLCFSQLPFGAQQKDAEEDCGVYCNHRPAADGTAAGIYYEEIGRHDVHKPLGKGVGI